MTLQVLFPKDNSIPYIPKSLLQEFPNITTDPEIHSGWPHIKGTRILAMDIFRAQVGGNSISKIIMEFNEMDVKVTEQQLEEAFKFTLEWLRSTIDGTKTSQTTK